MEENMGCTEVRRLGTVRLADSYPIVTCHTFSHTCSTYMQYMQSTDKLSAINAPFYAVHFLTEEKSFSSVRLPPYFMGQQ